MEYRVTAHRIDAHGSMAVAKDAEVRLDTDLAGRRDAMNPVELLLAALAACLLKGIERVTPMLQLRIDAIEVSLEAIRQDVPPKLVEIRYEIVVDSAETDQRLDLLHRNLLKYANKDALEGQIYGIEPGNDGNRLIMDMIASGPFGLDGFEIVESSEAGMLAEVAKKTEAGEPIIFLGWEPHPMNANFKMTYLTGGDDFFGPNLGGAVVDTNVRAGYVAECPNTGKLLQNLVFSLPMENEIMGAILNDGADPRDAAKAWLAANPTAWEPWLDGVTTKDGGDAKAAVAAALQ